MKPAELDRKGPWSGSAGFVLLPANGVSDNSSASGLKRQGEEKETGGKLMRRTGDGFPAGGTHLLAQVQHKLVIFANKERIALVKSTSLSLKKVV